MTRDNEMKIQIKTGLSFCWLDTDMAEDLKDYAAAYSCSNRSNFICEMAMNDFGVWPDDKERLARLDEELKNEGYKNRADWLRDKVRVLNREEKKKLKYYYEPSERRIDREINELLDNYRLYGEPRLYFQDASLVGCLKIIEMKRNEEFDWKVDLDIQGNGPFQLDIERGTLVKVMRPSNIISDFHCCYLIRDRLTGDALSYIGWINDSMEKFIQHTRKKGVKMSMAVQSLKDIEEQS